MSVNERLRAVAARAEPHGWAANFDTPGEVELVQVTTIDIDEHGTTRTTGWCIVVADLTGKVGRPTSASLLLQHHRTTTADGTSTLALEELAIEVTDLRDAILDPAAVYGQALAHLPEMDE